nr:MAG TPA: hypothetical protein [Caudoviricetes sp.]
MVSHVADMYGTAWQSGFGLFRDSRDRFVKAG